MIYEYGASNIIIISLRYILLRRWSRTGEWCVRWLYVEEAAGGQYVKQRQEDLPHARVEYLW